jgi:hypothetical protein
MNNFYQRSIFFHINAIHNPSETNNCSTLGLDREPRGSIIIHFSIESAYSLARFRISQAPLSSYYFPLTLGALYIERTLYLKLLSRILIFQKKSSRFREHTLEQ